MSTELSPFVEVSSPAVGDGSDELPSRTLGRLTGVAGWFRIRLAAPGVLTRPRLMLIDGDFDGPDASLGDDSPAADELAEQLGIGRRRIDVARSSNSGPISTVKSEYRIIAGHRSPVAADVLTREQAIQAIDTGRRLADQEIDAGADLLIAGLAGSGSAVPLGVLTATLTGLEPVDAVPLSDTDGELWAACVTDLRDALFRIREQDKDVVSLVRSVGGAGIGALAGLIAQAAVRRTPVLLDGLPATVGALLAHRLAPGAETWFIAAGDAATRGGRRLQEMLGLPTVAGLDTDSPSGAGALLVFPLIQAALRITQEDASPPDPPASQ